jgi:hypothetical protein
MQFYLSAEALAKADLILLRCLWQLWRAREIQNRPEMFPHFWLFILDLSGKNWWCYSVNERLNFTGG